MMRVSLCLVLLFVHACLSAPALHQIEFKAPPPIGYTASVNPNNKSQEVKSDVVFFGGFNGITYEGPENGGRGYIFKLNTDRGPSDDIVTFVNDTQQSARPFALPTFVPRIISVLVNFDDNTAIMYEDVSLVQGDGKNMSGLPNLQYQHQGLAYTDEFGVDLFGNIQSNDPEGADLGGIVRSYDDTYWLGDAYRASIYHFDTNGKLLKRFIPDGAPTSSGAYGVPLLPQVYAQRREDRGFSAVALQGDILYAFMESPIDNPNTINNTVSKSSANIRILAFDTAKQSVFAEYIYVLSEGNKLVGDSKVDKIGAATSLGGGKFLVVEQDSRSGKDAFKSIFEIDVSQATDIHNNPKIPFILPPNTTIEQATLGGSVDIVPVSKKFIINLAVVGFDYAQVSGITKFNDTSVVVVNNNAYQLITNQFTGDGTVSFDRTRSSYFGLITGLNFTSSTTTTTFNPTSTSTGGTTGGVTTGQVSTGGFNTTTTSASTTNKVTTTTSSSTTNKVSTSTTSNNAESLTFSFAHLLICIAALALM